MGDSVKVQMGDSLVDVQLESSESWVERAQGDEWNFGIILTNGLKVGFGSCGPIYADYQGYKWVNLHESPDSHSDGSIEVSADGCIEVNARGFKVRLDQVIGFWERALT